MKKKILNELKEEMQLNYAKKEGILTGFYRGYNISMGTLNKQSDISYINIPLKCPEWFSIEKINIFLNDLKSRYKGISLACYEDYRIYLNYIPRGIGKNKTEIFSAIINEIMNFSIMNNLTTCCEVCGNNVEVAPILVNNVTTSCCVNCKLEINNSIAMNQQAQREKKSNIVGGIVGAFIGALIGSVVWIVIYQMGYIAAIGGLAIAVCNIKGYEMFGGKLDKKGIVITSIITIVAVYLAQHISLGLEIYDTYKLEGFTIMNSMKSVPNFLESESISRVFFGDLAIGYFLTLVGSVSYIHKAYKQSNYKIEVKDINF